MASADSYLREIAASSTYGCHHMYSRYHMEDWQQRIATSIATSIATTSPHDKALQGLHTVPEYVLGRNSFQAYVSKEWRVQIRTSEK